MKATNFKPEQIARWTPCKWKKGHPHPAFVNGVNVKIIKCCRLIAKVNIEVPEALKRKYGCWWSSVRHARISDLKPTDLMEVFDVVEPRVRICRRS